MDALFFGLLALAILLGPWIAIAILRQRLRDQARQFEQSVGDLVRRLHGMEAALRKLERTAAPAPSVTGTIEPVVPPEPAAVAESRTVKPEPKSRVPEEIPPPPFIPPRPPVEPIESQISEPAIPRPLFATTAKPVPEPTISDRIRSHGGLEEILGKNWLNKVGIVLLVMGIAFFLAHQLKTMGPAGKIFVGYAVSLALLGAGAWFERSERYRILARTGIGGGWALLFFTTYAMYHVPASQILSSQGLDLVLMLFVALAMVAHTLRYNSQVVTGLAFLLAYLTIFVSRVNVYSLTAGVVLALGIAIIAVRRSWFELEVFGILASYLNHFFWLRTIFEPMGGQRQPFPEFVPSAAILVSYWLIYRVSYVVRRIENRAQENLSTFAALLNSIGLLTLLKYQSVHPEWSFWVLLSLGAVELAIGQLPITRRRRIAFAVLSTIGATLLVAAIPFRYSGSDVSVLWIMESEAFFLAGIWSSEIVFTRLGMLAGLATAGQMIFVDIFHELADRLSAIRIEANYRVGLLVLGLSSLILYANAHWFSRRSKELFQPDLDRHLLVVTSFTAAALATAGLWMAFPRDWTAVLWSALALTLAILARYFDWEDIAIQANLISGAALIRVITFNLGSDTRFHGLSLRLITVSIVAALYYLTSHWTALTFRESNVRLSSAYTWVASVLVATVIWYEADPVYMALLCSIFALVLFQIGLHNRDQALRWQAYVAVIAAVLRMFQYNLSDGPRPATLNAAIYTLIPLAAVCYYIFANRESIEARDERYAATLMSWLGTITIFAITWYEVHPDWTVTAWACLTLLAFAAALTLKQSTFTQQGIVFSVVVLLRAMVSNFDGLVPGWTNRSLAVAAACVILFLSLYFCLRLREPLAFEPGRPVELTWLTLFVHPEQPLFFVPLLMITWLLALEMRHGLITVSWGIEGVLVFLFALLVSERSYRLSGLALLLLCVGKVVVIDVWGLNSRDRYITFIIMGCALLLVSFLYTRHRDTIKQFL